MNTSLFQSLRFRLPLFVILGATVPLVVGISLATVGAIKTIREQAKENLAIEAKSLKNSVDGWIDTNTLGLQNLSRDPNLISLDPQKQKPVLENFIKTYKHLYIAQTTNLQGINIARSDNKPLTNYSDRQWVKAGDRIAFDTLIDSGSKKPAVCLSSGIYQQKVMGGVVIICSFLDRILERAVKVEIGKTGYAVIVDDSGRVIAHPNPKFINGNSLTNLRDFPPVINLLAGNEGFLEFSDKENISWVSHTRLLDNGWGIIVFQEKSEAFLQEKQFKNIGFIIALGAIVIVSLIIWTLASNLVEPIKTITIAAEKFAEGDFSNKVDIKRQDELGLLALAFNSMCDRVEESFIALENQVRERKENNTQPNIVSEEELQIKVKKPEVQIEAIDSGDLTSKTLGSLDPIFDEVTISYNSISDDLKQVVDRVKKATEKVTKTSNLSKKEIKFISQSTVKQNKEIEAILAQMETMNHSLHKISTIATEADTFVKKATLKVEQGDSSMEMSAETMLSLGEATTTTKQHVKRLGKASRRIAKAIELIRKIALQTNVLAVNASIEASRAGEEGVGFTVVANEVQSLALQSTKAANDIEKLVLEIQTETNKVIKAMDLSTKKVQSGGKFLAQTRNTLQQIASNNQKVDRLVEALAKVTTEQSQTSKDVTTSIKEVVAIGNKNYSSANNISQSVRELQEVSENLKTTIGKLKIG